MLRAHFYVVDGNGLNMIKALLPTMTALSILPGIDMNKSVSPDDTLFIPIIKITTPNVSIIEPFEGGNGQHTGLHVNFQDGDDDAFFDYNHPCPPFCDPPPTI